MSLKAITGLCLLSLVVACSQSPAPDNGEKNQAVAADSAEVAKPSTKTGNIIFFGNSLTAAYGLDPSEGYVALIQKRLDSLGLPYKAINAGLSGETTAGGRERVNWVLRQPVDIFVLELGGNDALRGIDPGASYENLDAIIKTVKSKYPDAKVILAGMLAPPNLGEKYTTAFQKNYTRLAKEHDIALIPFFLEGVGGIPELNQADRIHPNKEGQKILLENVWRVLEPLLTEG